MDKYWITETFSGMRKSWTIWFNAICGVLVALLPIVQDYLPHLQQVLTPGVYRWLMIAFVIGNVVLRIKTTTALSDK